VLEGDITACFDEISHSALLQRVRHRIGDKRVVGMVKAFLHAGVLSEDGVTRNTKSGTPQGALCSAEHKPPYEQRWVMPSVDPSVLVRTGTGAEHCT